MFTQVIIRKQKMYNRPTDRHTDAQHETIIPPHYCVAGYKNLYLEMKGEQEKESFMGVRGR